jgi:hypothetical protein
MPRQPAEFQHGGVVVENALGVDAGRIHESLTPLWAAYSAFSVGAGRFRATLPACANAEAQALLRA